MGLGPDATELASLAASLGPVPYKPSKAASIPGNWSIPLGLWELEHRKREKLTPTKPPWAGEKVATEFGRIVKYLGLSTPMMGSFIGADHSTVVRWMHGKYTPDKHYQVKALAILQELLGKRGYSLGDVEPGSLFAASLGRGRNSFRPPALTLHLFDRSPAKDLRRGIKARSHAKPSKRT